MNEIHITVTRPNGSTLTFYYALQSTADIHGHLPHLRVFLRAIGVDPVLADSLQISYPDDLK